MTTDMGRRERRYAEKQARRKPKQGRVHLDMSNIDDIRELADPEAYKQVLEGNSQQLRQRIAAILVDYDLVKDNPSMSDEEKKSVCDRLDKMAEDVKYRIDELDKMITSHNKRIIPIRGRLQPEPAG